MNKTAQAFAPAGISSFFEVCDHTSSGKPIADLTRIGARGGGFGLRKGVLTKIEISRAKINEIKVFLNGQPTQEAKTTEATLLSLLSKSEGQYRVVVHHEIEVPIGAGFGTSAGGALTAGLALKEALDLPLTTNQIGTFAHIAEIKCQTGLGTVSSLSQRGGLALVVEPGAPGTCIVDSIPLTDNYSVVVGVFQSIPKTAIFSSGEKRQAVSQCGKRTLELILAEPSLENFLARSWQFALETGFATDRVKRLVHLAEKSGALGAAQNMVGEAVHAVTLEENAAGVAEAFKQLLPKESVYVSKLDFEGARLIKGHEEI